jgi:hypothetical protein
MHSMERLGVVRYQPNNPTTLLLPTLAVVGPSLTLAIRLRPTPSPPVLSPP